MSKRPTPMTAEEQLAVIDYLKSLPKARPVQASPEFRQRFVETVVPVLKDQALSELRRNDQFSPRLITFSVDGHMAIVDVADAMGGNFGDEHSKNSVAKVHRFSATVPFVDLSVFCVETWILRNHDGPYEGSLANHPDAVEGMMFDAIKFNPENGELFQLFYMIDVIKVLGQNRSRNAWQGTVFGEMEQIIDPNDQSIDNKLRMRGRFVVGDPDNES